jgi:hypothetical protein
MTMAEPPQPPRPEDVAEEDLYVVGERLPVPQEVHDKGVAAAAVVTVLGGLVFGLGLLLGAPRTVYGGGLAIGLLAFAVGFHRYFTGEYPEIEAIEPRPEGAEDVESFEQVPEAPRGQACSGCRSSRPSPRSGRRPATRSGTRGGGRAPAS